MTFINNSSLVKKSIERQAIKGLIEAAMLVEAQAVLLVPVDSGALKESIGYKVSESELIAYVGTNVEYAIWVEFGTGEFAEKGNGRKGGWIYQTPDGKTHFTYGNKPSPYLKTAFRKTKKQVQRILEKALRDLGG
ncbi:HK97-gp10 family putative phage morphogenesis protein [Streptococcus ictaluri]|uniref:Phage protein, HK97 gp10 family n=1 Tax=Streptococcus ictaluri 707-05 TaxID=764299 RepID=G5K3R3_9STRE|nr:HK97-gp10 family putative phage morphogenesis protein [Streptococcus ictaluri]EHI69652.1 hypothetical protein STRIC_1434 [Streptococcus ictaluri 707-05]QBX25531.1 capsid and scaffold protein [Streptococcus phage Javan262]